MKPWMLLFLASLLLVLPVTTHAYNSTDTGTATQSNWLTKPASSIFTSIGTATNASQVTFNVTYNVVGGGSPYPPTFKFSSGGENLSETLSSGSWKNFTVDIGSNWTVQPNPLSGSSYSAGEIWYSYNQTQGMALAEGVLNFTFVFYHQYKLEVRAEPAGAGSTDPLPNEHWKNATDTVQISATPNPGFVFERWECQGAGCATGGYSGNQPSAPVTMSGHLVEIAHFKRQLASVEINASQPGANLTLDGRHIGLPYFDRWEQGSTHSIAADESAGCWLPFICQYAFREWQIVYEHKTDTPTDPTVTISVTTDGPKTIKAMYAESIHIRKQFQLPVIAGSLVALTIGLLIVILLRRRKAKEAERKRKEQEQKILEGKEIPQPVVSHELWYRLGFLSDTGRVRKNNEDSVLAFEVLTMFASVPRARIFCSVADGVGGSQKGEVASRLALQAIAAKLTSSMLQGDGVDFETSLRSAIEEANKSVVEHAMAHPESEGMATTIVAAVIDGTTVYIAHAGDSRAYLFTGKYIKRLTKDHSQVQELVDAGKLTPEQAATFPGRNVITRAVGAASDIQVDLATTSIQQGETLVLCTDGLWDPCSEQEMYLAAMQTTDPQAACRKLVALANERGGKDNISIVIVQCQGSTISVRAQDQISA